MLASPGVSAPSPLQSPLWEQLAVAEGSGVGVMVVGGVAVHAGVEVTVNVGLGVGVTVGVHVGVAVGVGVLSAPT